jgi:hypothetical protein
MKPTTTQSTGKILKACYALSILAILAGVVIAVCGGTWAVYGIGFAGYAAFRFLIWWFHG